MTDNAADRQRAMQRLLERAQRDPAFRAELIATPKAVVERELGIDLPEGTEIRVVEEQPNELYIILPAESDDLSDEDLDRVAGGLSQAAMPRYPTTRFS